MIEQNDCYFEDAADKALLNKIEQTLEDKDKNFGNARYVRTIIEHILQNQADRLAHMKNIEDEDLILIKAVDIA